MSIKQKIERYDTILEERMEPIDFYGDQVEKKQAYVFQFENYHIK